MSLNLNRYDGHSRAPWKNEEATHWVAVWDTTSATCSRAVCWAENDDDENAMCRFASDADRLLITDAPLLLAELVEARALLKRAGEHLQACIGERPASYYPVERALLAAIDRALEVDK